MRNCSGGGVIPEVAVRETFRRRRRSRRRIERYRGDAFALAEGLPTDPSSARNVVQSAAFKAWRRMGQSADDSRAEAWLLTIVVNERRQLMAQAQGVRADPDSASRRSAARGIDQHLDVRFAMLRLKSDDRIVLSLRFLMDMSVEGPRMSSGYRFRPSGADRPSGVQVRGR